MIPSHETFAILLSSSDGWLTSGDLSVELVQGFPLLKLTIPYFNRILTPRLKTNAIRVPGTPSLCK